MKFRQIILTLVSISIAAATIGCSKEDASVSAGDSDYVVTELANGARLIIQPYAPAAIAGIQMVYEVGFMDEPDGQAQISHLMEHLLCRAPTEKYGAGESWNILSAKGSINAETLPTLTRIEMTCSPSYVDEVFAIESDRIRTMRIDQAVKVNEAARCYAEIDAIEGFEGKPLVKFGAIAAQQNWRSGRDIVTVRSGLQDLSDEALALFYRTYFRPDNLTIIVTGGVDPDAVIASARKHIEPIEVQPFQRIEPIEWGMQPLGAAVAWDASVAGVFVWFPPVENESDRRIMSLWGNLILSRLQSDIELSTVTQFIIASSHIWPVGKMPFFIYATPTEGYRAEQVDRAIRDRIAVIAGEMSTQQHANFVRTYAQQLLDQQTLTGEMVEGYRKVLAGQDIRDEEAMKMILLQHGINIALRDHFFGGQPEANSGELLSLDQTRLAAVLRAQIDPEKMHSTVLLSINQQ